MNYNMMYIRTYIRYNVTQYIHTDEPKYTDIGITLQHYVKYDLWIVFADKLSTFSLWCGVMCCVCRFGNI